MTSAVVDALILDLLEWVSHHPRPYREVIEVWGTTCPRLPVWEEANERGLLTRTPNGEGRPEVSLSAKGYRCLDGRTSS